MTIAVRAFDIVAACTAWTDAPNSTRVIAPVPFSEYQLAVATSKRFLIDNVVALLGEEDTLEDLPPAAMPARTFWMEFLIPTSRIKVGLLCFWDETTRTLTGHQSAVLANPARVDSTARFTVRLDEEMRLDTNSLAAKYEYAGQYSVEGACKLVLFTLGLLTAHNVSVRENLPSRTFRRHAGQFHHTASDVHYTLEIPGSRQFAALHGSVDQVQRTGKRLHFVRGHFADYRRAGLFGKHRRIIYVGPHVRGDEGLGEVHKDYRVQ